MILDENIGPLERLSTGPNKGKTDRKTVASQYGFSLGQIGKAYSNWSSCYRHPYEQSTITFKEYLDLLRSTGITPDDVSITGYHLSRYNDDGCYHKGTCRFLQAKDNLKEQVHVITDEHRSKMIGRRVSEETKDKIRKANLGKVVSEETKRKLRSSAIEQFRSSQSKEQMRNSALNRKIVRCEHCGVVVKVNNYARWHGAKCKYSGVD